MTTETLTVSDAGKRESTRFGIGFELTIGGQTVTLEPRALWSADELKQGTFHVALPKDETRNVGSFTDLWKHIDDILEDRLPDLDVSRDPFDNLVKADVILREFELKV